MKPMPPPRAMTDPALDPARDPDPLRWLIDRIPGVCLIETDAAGVFTHFGPGAEAMFACPAAEALGRLAYAAFHDPAEIEACHGSESFRRAIEDPGWTEQAWRVIPRGGEPFMARVTLVPIRRVDTAAPSGQNEIIGWRALYRRIEPAPGL